MFYRVTARLKIETAAELHRKLSDGTIGSQRPDGPEIVAALNRAVLSDDGHVAWSELCYCPTPLAHERAMAFDLHFNDLNTTQIDEREDYEGRPFMDYLAELAGGGDT